MTEGAFAVVIPTYQRCDTVERAVRSVLTQAAPDSLLVVVDDGSTDHTARVLTSIDDPRLIVHRQDNAGRCAARNVGAALSKSDWLIFLDSDDELLPGALEAYRRHIDANDLILASVIRVEPDGVERVQDAMWDASRCLPWGMQAGAFAMRKTLFERIGGYCEQLEYSEHTEMALRLRRIDPPPPVAVLPEPAVRIHVRPDRYDAEVQYRTAIHLLDHVGPELRRDRRTRATYHGIAGVGASRLGMRKTALGHLWRSLVASPSLTAAARIGRAAVAPFGYEQRSGSVR